MTQTLFITENNILCLKDAIPEEHCVPLRLLTLANGPEAGGLPGTAGQHCLAPSPGCDVPLVAKGLFWHPIHLGSQDVPEPMQALAGSKPSADSRGMLTG